MIVKLFVALRFQDDFAIAARTVATSISPASEHANCARSFRALYNRDRTRAAEIAERAQAYLDSQS